MKNMQTPWGSAISAQELAVGILWIETALHGGLLIEAARARIFLSERALQIGQAWGHYLVYEQDKAMPVVFYEHPELYPWVEEELTAGLASDYLHLTYPEYFR
jgi:hypothetical protein